MGDSSGDEAERSVIRVYDDAGNVIETHEHAGDVKRAVARLANLMAAATMAHAEALEITVESAGQLSLAAQSENSSSVTGGNRYD